MIHWISFFLKNKLENCFWLRGFTIQISRQYLQLDGWYGQQTLWNNYHTVRKCHWEFGANVALYVFEKGMSYLTLTDLGLSMCLCLFVMCEEVEMKTFDPTILVSFFHCTHKHSLSFSHTHSPMPFFSCKETHIHQFNFDRQQSTEKRNSSYM